MKRLGIVFSGSGGQGVITAAIIFAEAAAIHENKNAIQSQIYGAAARGGASRSDVIISDEVINFPRVIQPRVLVCLTQEAYNSYCRLIRPGGLLITDSEFVEKDRKVDARHIELPIYQTVMEKIGNDIVFNICMLGAVQCLTEIVKPESIIKVIESRIPEKYMESNKKALQLGIDLGAGYKSSNNHQLLE